MTTLALYQAEIPMGRAFRHASWTRNTSASVLLRLAADGHVGWGEAAPRAYVTGESIDSVVTALGSPVARTIVDSVCQVDSATAVEMLISTPLPTLLAPVGARPAPAAAAALETAVLDLVARRAGRPVGEIIRTRSLELVLRADPRPFPASLVIDLNRDPMATLQSLPADLLPRLHHVKLKAGASPAAAVAVVSQVRSILSTTTTLSVDANGAWTPHEACEHARWLAAAGLSWVEEPTLAREWSALAAVRAAGLPVMLDESCTGVADLSQALEAGAVDLVNVRVSKCGGPLRAAALVHEARIHGLGVQLGVQVGEVGPLWAAGRMLGSLLLDPVACEVGRQDEWFPAEHTSPGYTMDRHTYLAQPIPGPGLGMTVTEALLARCTQPEPAAPTAEAPC